MAPSCRPCGSSRRLPAVRPRSDAVRAQAPWEGRVRICITGPAAGVRARRLHRSLAADAESSALQGAQLACPGAFEADYAANTQRGERALHCHDGNRRSPVRPLDLRRRSRTRAASDDFVLTGGTGAYQGVTGDGDMSLRLTLSEMTRFEQLEAEYDVKGWPPGRL